MIWDVHCHFPRDWQNPEGEDHAQLDTGEFWEYDPDTDTWTELNPHPGSGRWAPGSMVIGNTIYIMGGLSTTTLETSVPITPPSTPSFMPPGKPKMLPSRSPNSSSSSGRSSACSSTSSGFSM